MALSGYSEDALVEQPAIALLAELGWETVNAYHEFDHGASTLGRETKKGLLATLKAGKLVLDWRKRQQARAEVRVTIEKLLDQGLPRAYTP